MTIEKAELDKIRKGFNPDHDRARMLAAGVPKFQIDMLVEVDKQLLDMSDEELEKEVLSAREQGVDI